jgi:hypothetical protein
MSFGTAHYGAVTTAAVVPFVPGARTSRGNYNQGATGETVTRPGRKDR